MSLRESVRARYCRKGASRSNSPLERQPRGNWTVADLERVTTKKKDYWFRETVGACGLVCDRSTGFPMRAIG